MSLYDKKSDAVVTHKNNLAASIKRRMEVARANNDDRLLELLQKEQRQLGLN
ncbi:MAG: hypothetical protein HC919_13750 [Oscillatoriales cyanobacterium SM2_2_1]|nr:hypothetical protein [Oscillatoriales cyanobacterium SM2_2_1]